MITEDVFLGLFEYGAILKGSQTELAYMADVERFEYGAILKGSQTYQVRMKTGMRFEYGAILKGSQTFIFIFILHF